MLPAWAWEFLDKLVAFDLNAEEITILEAALEKASTFNSGYPSLKGSYEWRGKSLMYIVKDFLHRNSLN